MLRGVYFTITVARKLTVDRVSGGFQGFNRVLSVVF